MFFGTSSQLPIGSETFKRNRSLLQQRPELVVDVSDKWKKRRQCKDVLGTQSLDTYSRFVVPASNIDRNPEDGCMKKIKIERSLKLRREDCRGRSFNLLSNAEMTEENWLGSFGDQREVYEP